MSFQFIVFISVISEANVAASTASNHLLCFAAECHHHCFSESPLRRRFHHNRFSHGLISHQYRYDSLLNGPNCHFWHVVPSWCASVVSAMRHF